MCIFGFSLFFGLSFPTWIGEGENSSTFNTGSELADQIFTVLLSTSMFVGGATGFILDNTVPGTEEERGMAKWRQHLRGDSKQDDTGDKLGPSTSDCYDLPCGMSFLRRWTLFRFVPFCPTFLADVKETQGTTVDDDVEGAGLTSKALK